MANDDQSRRDTTRVSSPGPALKDKATDQFGNIINRVEDMAGKVADQGREVGEHVQEVAGNLRSAVDKSVKDQPMATLAVAALFGFVLGAIWKS